MDDGVSMLSADTIIAALRRLPERLEVRGTVGEVNLLKGTAMILGFRARQSTKDVDAIFAPTAILRDESKIVADELNLPADWLNDAAKGYASPRGDFRSLPEFDTPYLRVQVPTAEYLLAMKVLAARAMFGTEAGDRQDIGFLIRHLKLTTPEEVFDVVERYYDPSRLLPRSFYLVDEILSEGTDG